MTAPYTRIMTFKRNNRWTIQFFGDRPLVCTVSSYDDGIFTIGISSFDTDTSAKKDLFERLRGWYDTNTPVDYELACWSGVGGLITKITVKDEAVHDLQFSDSLEFKLKGALPTHSPPDDRVVLQPIATHNEPERRIVKKAGLIGTLDKWLKKRLRKTKKQRDPNDNTFSMGAYLDGQISMLELVEAQMQTYGRMPSRTELIQYAFDKGILYRHGQRGDGSVFFFEGIRDKARYGGHIAEDKDGLPLLSQDQLDMLAVEMITHEASK